MPADHARATVRALLSAAVGTALVIALAGCTTGDTNAAESPNPATSDTPAPADPTSSADPEAEAEPVGVPITLTCDELLTPQAVYDYNPNFGTDPNYAPAADSLAASIVDYSGLACGWLNQTSGETFDVAVANLPDDELTLLKNQAYVDTDGQMVPTYGDEAYFRVVDGVGEARVFSGTYWIVVTSTAFYEPGDAIPIVEPVLAALAG